MTCQRGFIFVSPLQWNLLQYLYLCDISGQHFSGLKNMFNYNCLVTQDLENKVLVHSLM